MDNIYPESLKKRPFQEWSSTYIFRPLAHRVVLYLLPTRVTPHMLVYFHTFLGLLACVLLARGWAVIPALLLQIKTVLDNADGQLARAKHQTTDFGRYLDSNMDFVVNTALFIGVGCVTSAWVQAFLGWVLLALVGSIEYQWEKAYQEARGAVFRESAVQPSGSFGLQAMQQFYTLVFSPQDRLIMVFSRLRLKRVLQGTPTTPSILQVYHSALGVKVLAQLGLSTQLFLAGLCIGLGKPIGYVYLLYIQFLVILGLQLLREQKVKRLMIKGATS